MPPVCVDDRVEDVLVLVLTRGIGPTLVGRLIEAFGSPANAMDANAADLAGVRGIGKARAESLARGWAGSRAAAKCEIEAAAQRDIRIVSMGDASYPPLLRELEDAPPLLWLRGDAAALTHHHTVAMVGTRRCTHYGIEQTERFAAALAQAGLCVVSGGARGVDTAAHRAALRDGGKTAVVMGCGLGHCYPPENTALFDKVVDSGGVLVSELPINTGPKAEQFPARNRIISGLSLGTLVTEAPLGSGALITARVSAEEHGREVLAVPGRVDSSMSAGCHWLLKNGGAAVAREPGDVLDALAAPARHAAMGTHSTMYAGVAVNPKEDRAANEEHEAVSTDETQPEPELPMALGLSDLQAKLVRLLRSGLSADELAERSGLAVAAVRAELTVLEVRKAVRREGGVFRALR